MTAMPSTILRRSGLRSLALLVGLLFALLAVAADGSARTQTTNPGAYLTVRVSVTNKGITMSPTHARRGQTAIFLLWNHATIPRVFALGDVSLTHHRGTGFVVKLARNEQKRVLLYLTYRGLLPAWLGNTHKTKVVGAFRVT
jgi:hypothetical protein